jgi:hypothetical protein
VAAAQPLLAMVRSKQAACLMYAGRWGQGTRSADRSALQLCNGTEISPCAQESASLCLSLHTVGVSLCWHLQPAEVLYDAHPFHFVVDQQCRLLQVMALRCA